MASRTLSLRERRLAIAAKRKTQPLEAHRVVSPIQAFGVSRGGGNRLLTAGWRGKQRGQVCLLDAHTGQVLGAFGTERAVVCWYAEQSRTGLVAAGFGDLSLRVWNPETDESRELGRTGGIIASVAWSADGRFLFTGNCGDKTVRLWELATGKVVASGTTKLSGTWFVAMTGDAKLGVSGSADKAVHLWEPATGRSLGALTGHTGQTGYTGKRTGNFDPPPFTPAPVVLPDGGVDGGARFCIFSSSPTGEWFRPRKTRACASGTRRRSRRCTYSAGTPSK